VSFLQASVELRGTLFVCKEAFERKRAGSKVPALTLSAKKTAHLKKSVKKKGGHPSLRMHFPFRANPHRISGLTPERYSLAGVCPEVK